MKKTKVVLKGKLKKDYTIDASCYVNGNAAVAMQLMVNELVEMLFDNDIKEEGFNIKKLKRLIDKRYDLRKKEKENENSL